MHGEGVIFDMDSTSLMVTGAILIGFGVLIVVVTQIFLFRWLKKFNKEWGEQK